MVAGKEYTRVVWVIFCSVGLVFTKTTIYTEIESLEGYICSAAKIADYDLQDRRTMCSRLCHRNENCVSFFENSASHTCRLLSEVINLQSGDVISEDGWKYYARSNCNTDQGYTLDLTHKYCFKYFNEKLDYSGARNVCAQDGGHLLRIKTVNEQRLISEYLVRLGVKTYPNIDGSRVNGPWLFEDGSPIQYFSWATTIYKDEPLDGRDCVKLIWTDNFQWGAARCDRVNRFLCQIDVY